MDELHHLKSDMQDMEDTALGAYKEEMKKTGRTVGKAIAMVWIVLAVIAGVIYVCWQYYDRVYVPKKLKAQFMWEQQVFSQLDEWYEKKEFDQIQTFQTQMYQHKETKNYSIYRWEHSWFMEYYDRYTYLQSIAEQIQQGEDVPEDMKGMLLYEALHLVYFRQMLQMYGITTTENEDLLEEYAEYAKDFLHSYLEIDSEELPSVYEQVTIPVSGVLSFEQCEKYAEKMSKSGSGE